MRVSYRWLKSYIDFPYSPAELSKKLTMAGLEVEEMIYLGEGLEDIVVGEITEIKEHPNADKLVICMVDTEEEKLQLITGAPNVVEEAKVPIAKTGVTLPTGMEIKETRLRGKPSYGMICSEDELGLKDERQPGIMILDDSFEVGSSFIEEYGLDDYVFKLDLTPNYARCLGMLGIAREIKAMLNNNNKIYFPTSSFQTTEENIKDMIDVKIEDEDLCRRYTGRVIKDVKVDSSPLWMQRYLKSAGIRPINNIVDITNYVMLEYNQPLHAFDFDRIDGKDIIVRRSSEDETIVTLDDTERKLNQDVLLIADKDKPIGMAGVMGGKTSEVSEDTVNVFLESAYFAPLNIRKTSTDHGIHSEASHRFERGVDIEAVVDASNRATYLLQKYADGKVVEGLIDRYPVPYEENVIELEVDRINRILGLSLSDDEIKDMLDRLEFDVEIYKNSGLLKVQVPSYRSDVEQKCDLIEEIARMYGYNNIPVTVPERREQGHRTKKQEVKKNVKEIMISGGLDEINTFSLVDKKIYDELEISGENNMRNWVEIKNPLSEAFAVMRTLLFPGTVEVLSNNKRRQLNKMAVFEIGRIYKNNGRGERPHEEDMIAGGSMGAEIESWNDNAPDFFYLKGVLEELFQRTKVDVSYRLTELDFLHPGRTALIETQGEKIGFLGELLPETINRFDLMEGTTIFQLSFDKLFDKITGFKNTYQSLPKFPAVNRDLAVVVDSDIPVVNIRNLMREAGGDLLEDVELFDLYEGNQIPEEKKSLAFNLIFRSQEKTLTDKTVNKVFNQILDLLKEEIGAEIRGN